MLTQNEIQAAVAAVYEDRARLAADLVKTRDSIRAVYKRWADKLGCLPNYEDLDAAIDLLAGEAE